MAVFSQSSKLHDIRFGTDGWRALIAKEFTYKNLNIFLDGLASFIIDKHGYDKPLIIGYDARFLADKFAAFAAKIINSWGIKVLLVNHPVPTPTIAHAAREQNSCGAITFTASHNPPEYMGIKYIPEYAGPSSKEITDQVLSFIDAAASDPVANKKKVLGSYTETIEEGSVYENLKEEVRSILAQNIAETVDLDPSAAYLEHLKTLVDMDAIQAANTKKQTKLIYDPIYGCGRNYTNKILEEAGFDLITLHDIKDPTFGGGLPEPTEKVLVELKSTIQEKGADLGAANDGDADRFAFMDGKGNFYPANKSLSIILKYLIEKRGFTGCVARTVATTHMLDDIAEKFNLEHKETAVGFKWLCEIMRNEDTILAAEESGGMSILGHIPEKDGILAIILMAEVLAVTGKTIEELWQEVQDFVGKEYFYDRLDLHLDGDAKERFMAQFLKDDLKEVAGLKVLRVDSTEGAKVYLENGVWFLARPSGTEAMARVYFEGNCRKTLENTVNLVKKLI